MMTLQEQVVQKVDGLSEDNLLFLLDMIERFMKPVPIGKKAEKTANLLSEKRQAFLHMEEMKKMYPFPKDYDYEQARKESMEEKYGCAN